MRFFVQDTATGAWRFSASKVTKHLGSATAYNISELRVNAPLCKYIQDGLKTKTLTLVPTKNVTQADINRVVLELQKLKFVRIL